MSLLRRIVVVSKQSELQQLAQQVGQEIFVADDLAEALDIVEAVNPELTVFDDSFTPSHIREFLDKLVPSAGSARCAGRGAGQALSEVEGTDKNSRNVPVVVIGGSENDAAAPPSSYRWGRMIMCRKARIVANSGKSQRA